MSQRPVWLRMLALLGLLAVLSGSVGCRTLGKAGRAGLRYFKYRGEDLAETFDIGLTFSKKPTISLYASVASLACLGYSNFQGHVLGMGGGQIGWIGHTNRCTGDIFTGSEQIVWHQGPRWRHYNHPMGLDSILASGRFPPPAYFPACTHYVHLLFIGVVANAKYAEMLDFLLGFTTLDIACDDGPTLGRWFFY